MMWDYAHLKPRYRRGEWVTVPAPWWKRALNRILKRRDGLGR